MTRLRDLFTEDNGASAILIAFTMVVLLGFAAVAIDAAGLGFNERRQDQSAADVGALAAVQFAVTTNIGNGCTGTASAVARCNGASEAIEVANATLDDSTLAQWGNAARCGTPPAGFTASSVSPCVAFNINNQRAWVRIPTIDKDTFLARAVGFDSIATTADAIAGADILAPGGVLPFLTTGATASGNYGCLKAASTPNFGACAILPATGNFGSADFFLYGNVSLGYSVECGGSTNRLIANIARGIDHPIGLHPTGTGSGIVESTNCPNFNAEPNMVQSQPGNIAGALEPGMLYGGSAYSSSSYPGRIEDPSGFKVRDAQGGTPAAYVDGNPLWAFLDTRPSLNGSACDDALVSTPALMEACIAWAKSTSTVVFNNNLVSAKRYGWTPELWETNFLTPSTVYHIANFRPVYIDTTMFNCSNDSCKTMYTPGVADSGTGTCPTNPVEARITCNTPGKGNDSLSAATAYILSQSIVPDNAKTPSPGSANQRGFNLID